jgi:predicted oxidoreductase (fatty acid repression mutant protein)
MFEVINFLFSWLEITILSHDFFLLNDNNNKFWDNTKAILKEVMGENRDFEPTEQKIDNFHKTKLCRMNV